jgi:hypothetical protein
MRLQQKSQYKDWAHIHGRDWSRAREAAKLCSTCPRQQPAIQGDELL